MSVIYTCWLLPGIVSIFKVFILMQGQCFIKTWSYGFESVLSEKEQAWVIQKTFLYDTLALKNILFYLKRFYSFYRPELDTTYLA